MIRESEYFYFAGRKSTDFGIINVNVSDGLYEEDLISNRTINEVTIPGRKKPYFIDITEEPKILQLRFAFLEKWNDKLIDEVVRWLNVDTYQPLYFEGNIDRVFYAMPVNNVAYIHNGLKEGYLNLTMRCNSSNSFSHEIITPIYNTLELSERQENDFPIVNIVNRGHYSIYPEIWIEKISDGDIVIFNKTNGNQKFEFKNIEVGEKLFIDCENEIINTNKENIYRYDDFNDEYLELIYGENILSLSNNMKIKFRYRYIYA